MEKINEIKTEWDLTPLLNNDEDLRIGEMMIVMEKKNYEFINKWKERSDYLEDAGVAAEALNEFENLQRKYGLITEPGYYFWLRSNIDSDNKEVRRQLNVIEEKTTKIANDLEFFEMRLAKIDKKIQKSFLDSKDLAPYRHFLKVLFDNAKYLLSEPEEKILNLKAKTSRSNWIDMVSNLLAKEEGQIIDKTGKKVKKPYAALGEYTFDENKTTRDSAAKALTKILEKHEEVAEYELNSILYDKKINDELRGLKRPDQASLLGDDIDIEVVDTMLDAVTNRFDIPNRFYELKAKLYGLEQLEYHERNLKYGKVNKKYDFEEAVALVHETLHNLDAEFGEYFKNYIENGRLDVFPKKGKGNGGFCISISQRYPIYIFMNYSGSISDVRTIAHEMGHAINHEMIFKNENALNWDNSLAIAEVASTFMEDFLLEKLESDIDDETRLSLMMSSLDDAITTIPRQVACYRFEQDLHKTYRDKGLLPKEEIEKIFVKHMKSYMGSAIQESKLGDLGWVGWSHIRRFFYVYSYASGLLISKALQNKVRKDGNFVGEVKKFLATGGSKSPKETFNEIGIDITNKEFWNQGLNEIEELLLETEKLAKGLGKI